MKIVVLYRPDSEYARLVETYVHDYKRDHEGDNVEMLNIDSREGSATAQLYDVMGNPAVLVLRDDGSVLSSWQGPELPLMSELAAYSYA